MFIFGVVVVDASVWRIVSLVRVALVRVRRFIVANRLVLLRVAGNRLVLSSRQIRFLLLKALSGNYGEKAEFYEYD